MFKMNNLHFIGYLPPALVFGMEINKLFTTGDINHLCFAIWLLSYMLVWFAWHNTIAQRRANHQLYIETLDKITKGYLDSLAKINSEIKEKLDATNELMAKREADGKKEKK